MWKIIKNLEDNLEHQLLLKCHINLKPLLIGNKIYIHVSINFKHDSIRYSIVHINIYFIIIFIK